jgi:ATP-dependent DNA helicase PIF1
LYTEAERIQYFSERVILAPKNVEVATINDTVQEYLTGEAKNYLSADSAFQDGGIREDSIPQEYLNTLTLAGMPAHELRLKVGCPIILLCNLNSARGLCNGTRLIVTKLRSKVIEAKVLTGSHAGRLALFSHGQLYVALSQCTDCRNLHVLLPSDSVDGRTDNIVYKEVLR